jgi:hypothetical protein
VLKSDLLQDLKPDPILLFYFALSIAPKTYYEPSSVLGNQHPWSMLSLIQELNRLNYRFI